MPNTKTWFESVKVERESRARASLANIAPIALADNYERNHVLMKTTAKAIGEHIQSLQSLYALYEDTDRRIRNMVRNRSPHITPELHMLRKNAKEVCGRLEYQVDDLTRTCLALDALTKVVARLSYMSPDRPNLNRMLQDSAQHGGQPIEDLLYIAEHELEKVHPADCTHVTIDLVYEVRARYQALVGLDPQEADDFYQSPRIARQRVAA